MGRKSKVKRYFFPITGMMETLQIILTIIYQAFAISLYKEYRGLGIGTRLMEEMLALLKNSGYKRASLAVQKANYAVKMYQDVGFKIFDQNEEEYIMVNDF